MSELPVSERPRAPRAMLRVAERFGRGDGQASTLLRSPAYLGAILAHAVALLVLSAWQIAIYVQERHEPLAVKVVALAEVSVPTPDREALLAGLDALDLTPAAVDVDSAFDEARGAAAGVRADTGAAALGLAGSGGFGRGGDAASAGGASDESGASLASGLAWLARHRSGDGAWGELPRDHTDSQRLAAAGDAGRTSLALLAFLMAGHGPDEPGPYRDLVREARDWLAERVGKDGRLRPDASRPHPAYHQALATLALGEALARGDDPRVREALKRAAGCVQRWQTPGRGFRYTPGQDSDTSITSWMVLALRSAEHAGVLVDPVVWAGVRSYLDEVTSDPAGSTGYTGPGGGSPAMNATGLFLRVLLGEPPATPRNLAATRQVAEAVGELQPGKWDLYQLYYTQLALYQVGGDAWRETNPRVRDGLVQHMCREGCEEGSWLGGNWAWDSVLATCFATLTLETYFRYLPVHAGARAERERERAEEQERAQEARQREEADPAVQALCRAAAAMERARRQEDPAELLVAEAEGEAALELAAAHPEPRRARRLQSDVLRLLIEVALRARDPARAERRLAEHEELRGPGAPPDPALEVVRRELALARLDERARAALSDAADPAALPALIQELLGQAAQAEREAAEGLRPDRARARALAEGLRALVDQLSVAAATRAGGDPVLALQGIPAEGLPGAGERAAIVALVRRGIAAYEGGPQAWAEGDAIRAALDGRGLPRRLERAPPDDGLLDTVAQLEGARIRALAGAGSHEAALQAARLWRFRFPGAPDGRVAAGELQALLGRLEAGQAPEEERQLLTERLETWAGTVERAEAGQALRAVAASLLARGDPAHGRRLLLLARERVGAADEPVELRLAVARAARAAGEPKAALAELDALPGEAQKRLDARRERIAALSAAGRPREAVEAAHQALRGLPEASPEWWDVLEDLALAHERAAEVPAARQLLDGARRKHPALGGEARARRLATLMHRLDALR